MSVTSPSAACAPWESACGSIKRPGSGVAQWLQQRPEVKRVCYPPCLGIRGMPCGSAISPGRAVCLGWCSTPPRSCSGADGRGVSLFQNRGELGGVRKSVIPAYPAALRTAVPWTEPGFVLRYHVGLEDAEDLLTDLDEGFQRLQRRWRGLPAVEAEREAPHGLRQRRAPCARRLPAASDQACAGCVGQGKDKETTG